jgi:hypothetical protein
MIREFFLLKNPWRENPGFLNIFGKKVKRFLNRIASFIPRNK